MSEPVVLHGHNPGPVVGRPRYINNVYGVYAWRYRHRSASYVDPTPLS